MCHTKEVSIIVFLFSLAVAINLFRKNDMINTFAGLYILALGSMQLVEFFLHWYGNDKSSKVYQAASWFIVITFIFQFVAASSCVHYYQQMPALCIIDIVYYAAIIGILILLGIFCYGGNIFVNEQEKGCEQFLIGCKLTWHPFLVVYDNMKWLLIIAMICYLIYVCWATYIIFHWSIMVLVLGLFLLLCIPYLPLPFPKSWNMRLGPVGSAWCLYVVIISCLLVICGEEIINGPNLQT